MFWHSSAHVLGCAIEREVQNVILDDGPPKSGGGYFYDFVRDEEVDSQACSSPGELLGQIERTMERLCREKSPFERSGPFGIAVKTVIVVDWLEGWN